MVFDIDDSADPDELRKLLARCTEGLPVIVAAACPGTLDVVRAMKAGASDFILKPVDEAILGDAVRAAVAATARAFETGAGSRC